MTADISSVVGVLGRRVKDLRPVSAERLRMWLGELPVPAGWFVARIDGDAGPLSRVTLCGQRPQAGWDACETISVFSFTGTPPPDVVIDSSDCTLRDLRADSVSTHELTGATEPHVVAVRSTGYFTAEGRRVWGQYSTYVAGALDPGTGLLIEHVLFVESGRRAQLRGDIAELSDVVHETFLTQRHLITAGAGGDPGCAAANVT